MTLHPRWTLAVVCTATFMLLLDLTIVASALGDIQADFHSDLGSLQWVVDGYTLPLAGLLLTAATFGDRVGRRRLFIAGTAVFTLGSLACAFAWSPLSIAVSRAGQGVGAGLLFAVGLPLIATAFPTGRARAGAVGIFGATQAGATAVGPLIGGALVDGPGWRWIFLVNVPIGAAVLAATLRWVTESRGSTVRSADWPGTFLLTSGLFALVLGLVRGNEDGWSSARVLMIFAAAVLLLVGFVLREWTAKEPMLDLKLFAGASFTSVSLSVLIVSGTLVAATNYIALYLINTLSLSPLQAGLRFLPLSLAAFLAAPVTARLVGRVPPRITVGGGVVLVAAGLALAARVDASSSWTVLVPGFVVGGLGLGMVNASAAQAALAAVHHSRAGMATGVVNTMRQVGTAAGVAVLGALFQHRATTVTADHLDRAGVAAHQAGRLADAVGSGAGVHVADGVAGPLHPILTAAVRAAGAGALRDILIVGAIAAGVIAVAAVATIRASSPAPSPEQPAAPKEARH